MPIPVGCSTISGIAALENPRILDGKTILFDAHFFIYDTPQNCDFAGVSLLRYFNGNDRYFGDVEKYFVHAEVALMDEKCNMAFLTEGTSREDYFMVGDILQLIPADRDSEYKEDTKYPPFLTVGGIVDKVDDKWKQSPRSFHIDLNPNIYIQLLQPPKSKPQPNEPDARQTPSTPGSKKERVYGHMPVHCFIPESPRWPAAPSVRIGNFVTVAGYLQSVRRNDSKAVTGFNLELERVTYMGQPSANQLAAPPVIKRMAGTPAGSLTPPQKRMKFSYGNYQDTPTPPSRKSSEDH
ncbi:hypothetical protein VKT23_008881 [Stygiomarasmius scandens]|uniref:Uncharacterized protein n=1 Tax=Marasmiellus scandens TaxID=2682957 RepID=A0ABR1JIL9_9AGAR